MVFQSHKVIDFSLLFLLTSFGMPATAVPLPIVETVVEFTLPSESGDLACQGVRVSEGLIATSPLCIRKARESDDRQIELFTLQGEPTGVIAEQSEKPSESEMLLQIILDTEPESAALENYPELYKAPSPPEHTFAYTLNENDQLVVHPMTLSLSEPVTEGKFNAFSEMDLPSGVPVFDADNRLVCLLTSQHDCLALNLEPEKLFKRALTGNDDPTTAYPTATVSPEESAVVLGVVLGVPIVSATIATGLFYLASYMKAKSMGMPGGVFWPGILSLQYCAHCNSQSAIFAVLGFLCCPICLCPISAYMAVSNWVADYAGAGAESAPIVTQPY